MSQSRPHVRTSPQPQPLQYKYNPCPVSFSTAPNLPQLVWHRYVPRALVLGARRVSAARGGVETLALKHALKHALKLNY